jgi:nucleoside-diphosphate-sugar epimerase
MRILLTGHKGYIGSVLFDVLEQAGHKVIGIDLVDGQDIITHKDFPMVDLVIHLAGKSGVRESKNDPLAYWYHNVTGFGRILKEYPNTRILYASSSSAYEPECNVYAKSKHVMEEMAAYHPNALGMRFHTVYSDTPRKGMFMDKLIHGTLEYTTNHLRDFIHMDDIISATTFLMERPDEKGVIDIGTGVSWKISDIVPELPVRTDTEGERLETRANMERMNQLGWDYSVDFRRFCAYNLLA